jgi:hypothetical protein
MLHIGTFWRPLPIIHQQFIKVVQKSQSLSKIEQNYKIRDEGRIKKKNGIGLWSKNLTEKFSQRAREYKEYYSLHLLVFLGRLST